MYVIRVYRLINMRYF